LPRARLLTVAEHLKILLRVLPAAIGESFAGERVGWLGAEDDPGFVGSVVDALPGLVLMSAWLVLTALAVKRFFRWEPRHR
jgi:hypothetical protein